MTLYRDQREAGVFSADPDAVAKAEQAIAEADQAKAEEQEQAEVVAALEAEAEVVNEAKVKAAEDK